MAIETTTPTIPAGTWAIDPEHTTVGFSVRHAGVSNVRGRFRSFEGTLEAGDEVRAAGSVELTSVDTGVAQRDDHLRSEDFFACDRFPRMTFVSRSVRIEDGEVEVAGELTLRGVTNELVLRGELGGVIVDDDGLTRVGPELTGQLSRAAFGMRFNHALGGGNMLVGDRVKLAIEVSATLQS